LLHPLCPRAALAELTLPTAQVVGFPLELLGVMSAGVLALRYTKEGVNPEEDLKSVVATLKDTLPGMK